ncbi:YdcF family protein [Sphingomonas sp.]|uniref:YdcF family protein n=1 Tax=Sphingomonas sp. TaxID=28214 RepID=UPI0025FE1BCA|nr:YdcF family protein [Sphingomonas sp.]
MIRRVLSLIVLLWVLGFVLFVVTLPQPADNRITDAIVVPTGAPGRIQRGLALLQVGRAKRMLITGVDRSVKPHELAIAQGVPLALFGRTIDLGREAVDTRSNGEETATWLAARNYRSVRLVTTDWHMRRARFEMEHAISDRITIVSDAVVSQAGLTVLMKEYNKYLFRRVAVLFGL